MDDPGRQDLSRPPQNRSADTQSETDETAGRQPRYDQRALRQAQPHTVDLLPHRLWVFWGLSVLITVSVALLGYLHVASPHWQARIPQELLAPFQLAHPNCLASWWSMVMLLLAAVASAQIYALRRHRNDDYRGRYRVWLWISAALVLASIDATTHIHRLAQFGSEQLVRSLWSTATIPGWQVLLAVGLVGFFVRIYFELRESRLALSHLIVSYVAVVSAFLLASDVVALPDSGQHLMTGQLLILVGQAGLLQAIVAYGRYVTLDAHGQVQHTARPAATRRRSIMKSASALARRLRRPAKPKRQEKPADAEDQPAESRRTTKRSSRKRKSEKPDLKVVAETSQHSGTKPTRKSAKGNARATATDADELAEMMEDTLEGSPKSQRRRQRKKQRRDRRQAA